jgi:hypothetical protein
LFENTRSCKLQPQDSKGHLTILPSYLPFLTGHQRPRMNLTPLRLKLALHRSLLLGLSSKRHVQDYVQWTQGRRSWGVNVPQCKVSPGPAPDYTLRVANPDQLVGGWPSTGQI